MAASSLVIDTGKRVTTSTAGLVRQVIVPIGTMSLAMTSEYKFFLDFTATADDAAETVASQMLFHPGTYILPLWTLGGRPQEALRAVMNLYVVGANASQYIYFLPMSVR